MEKTTVADLSVFHHLVTDLFRWPSSKAEWDQYRLSKEQVDFFHEYGYVANIKLLDDWQIEKLNEEYLLELVSNAGMSPLMPNAKELSSLSEFAL